MDWYCIVEYTLPTWVNLMMYWVVVVMAAESHLEQLTLDGAPRCHGTAGITGHFHQDSTCALTTSCMYIDIEFISYLSAVARLHSKLYANSELA